MAFTGLLGTAISKLGRIVLGLGKSRPEVDLPTPLTLFPHKSALGVAVRSTSLSLFPRESTLTLDA